MKQVEFIRRQAWLSALLLLGVIACVVGLLQRVNARWDLTEEKIYSLSPALVEMITELDDRLQIKLYFNRDIEGAEHLLPTRLTIQDRLAEIAAIGGDFVSVETVDPTVDLLAARDAEHIGITPVTITDARVGGVSLEKLYQGLELRYLDRSELIPFVVPDEFEFALATRLSALLQGDLRPVLGFFSREPSLGPPVPGLDQVAAPGRVFEELRENMAARYAIRDLSKLGAEHLVPEDLVGLIVARPEAVTADELYALRQYLERGGRILLLIDHEEVIAQEGFRRRDFDTGLDDWLAEYGVTVHEHFVYDSRARSVPVEVQMVTQPDGTQVQNPVYATYGLYPVVSGDGLSASHVATSTLDEVELIWAHPVVYRQVAGLDVEAEALLRTSPQARALPANTRLGIDRNAVQLIDAVAARQKQAQSLDLAVAMWGAFRKDGPVGKLVVIGDSDIFHNFTLEGGGSNILFAQNLIDWLASNERLIELRTRGRRERPLYDFYGSHFAALGGVSEDTAEMRSRDQQARAHRDQMERTIAWANVLTPPLIILLLALGHFSFHGRRARRAYDSERKTR